MTRRPKFPAQRKEVMEDTMEVAALMVALASLSLAAVAYWRSGGKRDIEAARQQLEAEIEVLRAKQREFFDSASEAIASAYDESRRRLERNRERLRVLKAAAVEGLGKQMERAAEQLHALAQRLDDGAKSVGESTLLVARNVEQGIARRVQRLEARTTLMYAKAKATRAVNWAQKRDFEQAERQLEEAADLLRTVRDALGVDHAYDEGLDDVKRALAEATDAVRARAEVTRKRIEHVLTEADKMLDRLESDEQLAASSQERVERNRSCMNVGGFRSGRSGKGMESINREENGQ